MDNNTGWTFKADPYLPNRYVISANGNWLMVILHNGEQLVERQTENLQKVVAATELLEALKRSAEGWANALELDLLPEQHRLAAMMLERNARAAIAKAEGKA